MKKLLPYILIFFIVVQLFAPFTIGTGVKNNIEIQKNKSEATEFDDSINAFKSSFQSSFIKQKGSLYNPTDSSSDATIEISVNTGIPENTSSEHIWLHVAPEATFTQDFFALIGGSGYTTFKKEGVFILYLTDKNNNKSGYVDFTNDLIGVYNNKRIVDETISKGMVNSILISKTINSVVPVGNSGISKLEPGKNYEANLYYLSIVDWYHPNVETGAKVLLGLEDNDKNYYKIGSTISIETATQDKDITVPIDQITEAATTAGSVASPGSLPACEGWLIPGGGGTFMGCVAQAFYYVFFATTSAVFAIAGKALDFTLMYSLSDTAYRSEFVTSGWGVVKDFSNIFFIFVLLYIAFGTILNLHSVKTKEMIINVVIIGLLINFSLFTTQVVIDASNILARVFYNDKTIITGSIQKDENGESSKVTSVLGEFGELQLSTAIVSGVNPQNLIINSREISRVKPASSGFDTGDTNTMAGDIPLTSFFLIVFLATIVNIVGIIAFTSTALIFIGRVVMLWLSMIVAPLAFFSYIVPQMQGIKMIGWKEWWPNLLKMAFVAPVFVFFMYLIVGFMGKGFGLEDAFNTPGGISMSGLSWVIKIIVPFAFVMILLMKAKDIAVNMSGEIGASLSKAGSVVGGLAVGAMTGGAAFAMRGTLGKLGQQVSESNLARKGGRIGRMVGDAGKWTASKTFDARNTAAGAAAAKGMGVDLGKAKEGGYTKHMSDKVEKKQKRAEELKIKENHPLKQKLNQEEMALQSVLDKVNSEFEVVEKKLVAARQKKADAAGGPNDPDYIAAVEEIKTLNDTKAAMKNANASTAAADKIKADFAAIVSKGSNDQKLIDNAENLARIAKISAAIQETEGAGGVSIKQRETVNIPDAKKAIEKENRETIKAYAKELGARGGRANKEAEHKIIMSVKTDSSSK